MDGKPEQTPVVSGRRPLTGVRRTADTGYAYLSALFFAAVLVQVFLAGMGVFGIDALEVDEASSFDAHRAWGFVLAGLAGVLLVLALAARESRWTMMGALVLFLLVMFAQSVLASIGESSAWVGGLHALDGMVILLISASALLANRRRRSR
jgi:hypothetical protein